MVDIWYPAEAQAGPPAEYLDLAAFEQALGTDSLRGQLGTAYDAIEAGLVRTHAAEGAPFARSLKRCPVLIFSHGSGAVSRIYTAQLEDLASHGYVVAAITHPYDALLTVFPDGRRIPFDTAGRKAANSSEEPLIAYQNSRQEWLANDIRFVLNELRRHNRTGSPGLPFAGHLDLERVGAFGHSAGGRAAARACQIDRRLRASVDQDGVVRFAPFNLSAQGWGMDQAFLLIERAPRTTPLTDEEVKEMGLTRTEIEALVARLKGQQDTALARTGGGSYRVRLDRAATTHMSFSDLPVLQASDRGEAEHRARVLHVVCKYTRTFFDKVLRGMKAPLLDGGDPTDFVEAVQRFEPAKHPRQPRRGCLAHGAQPATDRGTPCQ